MIPRKKLTVGAVQVGTAVLLLAGMAGAAVTTGQVLGVGSRDEVRTQSTDDIGNGSTGTTIDDKGGLRADDNTSTSFTTDDKGGHRASGSSDDGPDHDFNDDRGGDGGHGGHGSHGSHGSDD